MVVIAAVDRTERAKKTVEEAVEIAKAFDDSIHVVHVLSQSEFMELEQTEVKKSGRSVNMDRIRDHAASLAKEVSSEVNIDAEVKYIGLVGDAADRTLEYAESEGARYIVVSPRKKSPAGKVLFGSTSQEVLLNAPCSVVVTKIQS